MRVERYRTRAICMSLPPALNEDLAWLLGYFIGPGDGDPRRSQVSVFTCGESELSTRLVKKVKQTLGLDRQAYLGRPPADGGRWRVMVHSRELLDWLTSIGIDLRDKARVRNTAYRVRSPKPGAIVS